MKKLLICLVTLFSVFSFIPNVFAGSPCINLWQGALYLGVGNFGAFSCNQANNFPCGAAQGFPNATFCSYRGGNFDQNLNFIPVSSAVNCPTSIGSAGMCSANAGTVEVLNNLICPSDYFSIVSYNYKTITCTDATCSAYLNQNPAAQITGITSIASVPDQSISNSVCNGNTFSYSLCNSGTFVNTSVTCPYGCANSAGCLGAPSTVTAYCLTTAPPCIVQNMTSFPSFNCYTTQQACQNALAVTTPSATCSPVGLTGAKCLSQFTSASGQCSFNNCNSNQQLDTVTSTSSDVNVCSAIPNCYKVLATPNVITTQMTVNNSICIGSLCSAGSCFSIYNGTSNYAINFPYCPAGADCKVICSISAYGLVQQYPNPTFYPNGWNSAMSPFSNCGTITGAGIPTPTATCVEYATSQAASCGGYTGKLLLTKDEDGCAGFDFCGVGFGSAGLTNSNPKIYGATECAYQPISQTVKNPIINLNPNIYGAVGTPQENNILNSINTGSYCPQTSSTLANSCYATAGQPEGFNQIQCNNQYQLIDSYVYGNVFCNDASCSAYTSKNYTVVGITPYSFSNGTQANIQCDPYGNAQIQSCNNGNLQAISLNCTNGCFAGTGCVPTQVCQPNIPIVVNNITGTCNGNVAITTICNNLGNGNTTQQTPCSSTQTCQNGLCINSQPIGSSQSNGVNPSALQPIPAVNVADYTAAGYGWILPFFSPIFLDTLLMAGLTGAVSFVGSKAGAGVIVGSGTFLAGLIVLTIFGIYPSWIGIILVFITGFVFVRTIVPALQGQ